MILILLAFLGGVLTIMSPCILPIIPLAFSRVGRDFKGDITPMLAGVAIAFTLAALIATTTARWLLLANEAGRYVAIALLAVVGLSLASEHAATWLTRPLARIGASLSTGAGQPTSIAGNLVVGLAIGLLWAPCAGPILGLLIAAAATTDAVHAAVLFLTFALGAAMSLAAVIQFGSALVGRLARTLPAQARVRRTLGIATLVTVTALLFGWDRAIFAKGGLIKTASAEELLVSKLAPQKANVHPGVMSIEDFAALENASSSINLAHMDGQIPSLAGGTEWINSPELTAESLKGKVVLIDFWTFACYNCLNALPHVKDLYAKYKDRGFVVIGVHTPELAHERVPENVRNEVRKLGITYPVVIDNRNTIWNAFQNQYWPAAYYADATGKLRFSHFGEGAYDEQDKAVAKLLAERDAAQTKGTR